jgi:hypothetical protein
VRRNGYLAAALVAAAVLCSAGPAVASPLQISSLQDDHYLLNQTKESVVVKTLEKMRALGVQQIRVNLEWNTVAPDPNSYTEPKFNALNPFMYPTLRWAPYDRIAFLAPHYGMSVQFDITGPGPLWAMGHKPPNKRAATHWYPNATDFLEFVYAVGERYSGLSGAQTRVDSWSIWNEPNQPGWLAPQWSGGVAQSPQLYRSLAEDAYFGLIASGHIDDTILFGETAPEGRDSGGVYSAMTPIPFLRDLYCVNSSDQQLTGTAASALGCPDDYTPTQFVDTYPVLFDATGFAHHPYDFQHAPNWSLSDPNDVPLANIGRLTSFLDDTFDTYGIDRQIPIYFTEYGYSTNPPNPHQVVSPAEQAVYLNESDYLAWLNPRIAEVSQYELYDAPPNYSYPKTSVLYWGDSFQTGLLFRSGKAKPAYDAYQMEIWIPHAKYSSGTKTFIWGLARPADRLASQPVAIQWRSKHGSWRTVSVADTAPYTGYLTDSVGLPGRGYVRLLWSTGSAGLTSRTVTIN